MGVEQAREWFASDVLQPLMVAINSAHAEVIAGAAQLGFPGVRLTPLTDLGKRKLGYNPLIFTYFWRPPITLRRSKTVINFIAGTDNANKTADDSLMLAQISGRIEEYMRNPVNQSNPQLLNCMQAIITYQKLLLLLRGEYPSSLLPPAPDGYLLKRIEELASKKRRNADCDDQCIICCLHLCIFARFVSSSQTFSVRFNLLLQTAHV